MSNNNVASSPGHARLSVGDYVYFSRQMDAAFVGSYADLFSPARPGENAEHARNIPSNMLDAHFSILANLLLGKEAKLVSMTSEYLHPVRNGEMVTFSARVLEADPTGGAFKLNCLVLRDHQTCLHGVVVAEAMR